jgi:hypothetical protein
MEGKGTDGGKLNCLLPLPSFIHPFIVSVAHILGSATNVSGQKRRRLLYIQVRKALQRTRPKSTTLAILRTICRNLRILKTVKCNIFEMNL